MSDEQILNELIDFRRHGFTGLIEISLATFDFAQLKDWGTPAINTDRYKKITTLCEKAGIPGPHIIWSHSLPERVAEALDIKVDLHKDEWPVELKDAIKATVKELVRLTKDDVPWYFYGPDEPSGDNTYALQVYECWSEAGAKTYATFYNAGFLNKALQHLNIPCFVASMLSNENDWNKFYQQCQLPGVEFSWYGTGCYVNPFPQERYMYHNRYGAGFFFRKTNAVSAVAWTLCRPHGDIFNDFDGVEQNKWEPKNQAFVYPHLLKEDDWSTHQGNIPTIAWESHREGRNDYLYINTLENLIKDKRSKGSKKAKSAANKSKAKLDALLNDLPFVNILGSQQFETKVLGNCRKEIAKMIIDLSKVK